MAAPRVGGEVDAFCTRCKMTLAHTILAMMGSKIARVQCNTCGGQHAYRTESASERARSSTPRAPAPRKEVISFEQRIASREAAAAKPYSPKTTYAVDDLLQHPTFGLGIVNAVRQDKIDVAFKAYEKTLVHGRGEAPAAKPTFSPPHAGAPSAEPAGETGESAEGDSPEDPPSP